MPPLCPPRVEYFGLKLDGYSFTEHGWVQSYGSRYVRPPIVSGNVTRAGPMTVHEYRLAQAVTARPVKGMLTGPVTMLNWSFPRKDVARSVQAFQIALALRQEMEDLEGAGCRIVQVDEPALREGLPLKERRWARYLDWAVDAFKLSVAGAKPETQVGDCFGGRGVGCAGREWVGSVRPWSQAVRNVGVGGVTGRKSGLQSGVTC